jgi:hypothetical protein
MLKRQILIYKDGRKTNNVIYVDGNSPTTIYPKRDGIKHACLTTFKYKIKLKRNETVSLINFNGKKYLYPKGVEVHPNTTLKDVEVIYPPKPQNKPQINTYNVKSSTSNDTYVVKEVEGKYTCNCGGFFRVKDKEKGCKHIQNIKKQKI